MSRNADLIDILRRTLIDLEQSGHPNSEAVLELKRSILCSIAEVDETWLDFEPEASTNVI